MLKSMTGYGILEDYIGDIKLKIEIRSVNHKSLDIVINTSPFYYQFENDIRKIISHILKRGHIEVNIIREDIKKSEYEIEVNLKLAKAYYSVLKRLQEEFSLSSDIPVGLIANFKDVLNFKEKFPHLQSEWEGIKKNLEIVLKNVDKMCKEEGEIIYNYIQDRLKIIETYISKIEEKIPIDINNYKAKLIEKIKDIFDNQVIDETRILQEVALYSEKTDITEEIVRIKSHINKFKDTLEIEEPVGKKLDFLIQEILRELTTIGAKSNNSEITHLAVEIKNEFSKIREQLLNIV